MSKVILFGAGYYGKAAFAKYGSDNVAYFIDNNSCLWNTELLGKEILPVNTSTIDMNLKIIICSRSWRSMAKQLDELMIKNYEIFDELNLIHPSTEFITNPYFAENNRHSSEDEYIDNLKQNKKIEDINNRTDELFKKKQLFSYLEIETINKCNGICDFCPVSIGNDIRQTIVMSDELFKSIIDQLSEINYSGRIALFSNNEPFLDEKIIERHRYAREKLPNAWFHLYTNATLLSLDKFIEIMKYLNELVIDNYNQDLKLIKPCQKIAEYCEEHPELKRRVTIILRKPHEILSSRGGDAPNRTKIESFPDAKCSLPFTQMVIRPDGKVSLCCNDPYGRNTLADLTKESLIDAWFNESFTKVRECLHVGRGRLNHCKKCDFFMMDISASMSDLD